MKTIYPSYYKDFTCTAGDCSDSCCIGWEIDIDQNALARFRHADETSGTHILEHIDTSREEPHFVLQPDGRCPFLNDNNLCDIYITLGEQALCDICTLHPRFIQTYGSRTEYGLDLCCEEAARLILSQERFTSYKESNDNTAESSDFSTGETFDPAFFSALDTWRDVLFHLIGSTDISLQETMNTLLMYGEQLDDFIFDGDFAAMKDAARTAVPNPEPSRAIFRFGEPILQKSLSFLQSLTPLSVSWHNFLAEVSRDFPEIIKKRTEFRQAYPQFEHQARHLLNHYIYHYFLTALWEDEVYSKIFFAVFIVTMTELFDIALYHYRGTFCLQDQIYVSVQLSKEIEYCIENLEKVLDFAYIVGN